MTHEEYGRAYQQGFEKTVRILRSRGASIHYAEDVAQAAWLQGWRKLDQLRDESMIVSWVIAIAINLRARRAMPPDPRMLEDRETWRMPSLALLTQPVKSRGRLIALCTVRGYAIIAMVSLLIKTILASHGSH